MHMIDQTHIIYTYISFHRIPEGTLKILALTKTPKALCFWKTLEQAVCSFLPTVHVRQNQPLPSTDLHRLRGELDHMLHALIVVMPGLLFIDHIPFVLRKVQEAPNGAEVLPKRTIFWTWIFFPAKQLT